MSGLKRDSAHPSYKKLADRLARRLTNPSVLDEGLRSGLFIHGTRGTERTAFLCDDLTPALQEHGVLVACVDLSADTAIAPDVIVRTALSRLVERPGASTSGHPAQPGGCRTLAQIAVDVITREGSNVVLIIDEVQQALVTPEGMGLLAALKAARDAVNLRSATPGHFIVIGVGSPRAALEAMTGEVMQPFLGATTMQFPDAEIHSTSHLPDLHSEESGSR